MTNLSPILQIEDREEDVFLLQHIFKQVGIENPIYVAEDGQEGIDYLAGEGPYADREKHPFPSLVLLDLKLPRKMGTEVLEWIRADPALRSLIVIVLTSSIYEKDVQTCYDLGANAFLVKPSGMDNLKEMARALKDFWLVHNRPPPCAGL
ncbi:MAG TPA: response regulator [Opitutales bacterium]|nr:response regulator [Opitutales bacterium]